MAGLIRDNPAEKALLSLQQKFKLAVNLQWEITTLTEPTVVIFGMIPSVMAAWSLIWRGLSFEYQVAPKPLTHDKTE